MILMFFMICGVLKNRDRINPVLDNKTIKDAMRHPLTLTEILRFKSHKYTNLGLYVIGKLPASLSVLMIKMLGKRKGVL